MESTTNRPDCTATDNELRDCPSADRNKDVDVILSDEIKTIFEFVNFVFLYSLVATFGMAANIINIVIFCKQGFTNTVNIAFLGLSISDFWCLAAVELGSICMNPSLPVYDVMWISIEVMYLSAGWPHVCFCRITSYITVYITAERFISIAWPLKVKQIITSKRTTTIICLIYFVNVMTLVPEYATSYLGMRFAPYKNKTLVGIIFTSSRNKVEGVCYVVHALLSAFSFFAVIIFTFALVIKLRQSSKWRQKATLDQLQKESSFVKEQKTVKMVVLIATVLIICYTPGAIIAVASFIVGPELNVSGRFVNIAQTVWSFACVFQSTNASVNIFLYYKMSSKYRHTFNNIFLKVLRK